MRNERLRTAPSILLVVFALLASARGEASGAKTFWTAKSSTYKGLLPDAAPYVDAHINSAANHGTTVEAGLMIMMRESGAGLSPLMVPKGPGGTGDNGHGHGLMQIDDRSYATWIAQSNWQDPATNIDKGHQVLQSDATTLTNGGIDVIADPRPHMAAYNRGAAGVVEDMKSGAGFDAHTTNNYGQQVGAAAAQLHANAMVVESQTDHGTGCPHCNLIRTLGITADPSVVATPPPVAPAPAEPAPAEPAPAAPAPAAPAPDNTVRTNISGTDDSAPLGFLQRLFGT